MYIYVLLLEHNNYFIGTTNKSHFNLFEHYKEYKRPIWTELHHPVDLVDFVIANDNHTIDKYVITYMQKYGIDKVRGGSYSSVILDSNVKAYLHSIIDAKNVIQGANNEASPSPISTSSSNLSTSSLSSVRIASGSPPMPSNTNPRRGIMHSVSTNSSMDSGSGNNGDGTIDSICDCFMNCIDLYSIWCCCCCCDENCCDDWKCNGCDDCDDD